MSSRNSAFLVLASGPWHSKQWLARIGRTSRLKSATKWWSSATTNVGLAIANASKQTTKAGTVQLSSHDCGRRFGIPITRKQTILLILAARYGVVLPPGQDTRCMKNREPDDHMLSAFRRSAPGWNQFLPGSCVIHSWKRLLNLGKLLSRRVDQLGNRRAVTHMQWFVPTEESQRLEFFRHGAECWDISHELLRLKR